MNIADEMRELVKSKRKIKDSILKQIRKKAEKGEYSVVIDDAYVSDLDITILKEEGFKVLKGYASSNNIFISWKEK